MKKFLINWALVFGAEVVVEKTNIGNMLPSILPGNIVSAAAAAALVTWVTPMICKDKKQTF